MEGSSRRGELDAGLLVRERMPASTSWVWAVRLFVGLMANYTGFLVPKVALFSNIALMVAILLWRPQGVYPVANR